ncbi:MAG TPA: hypothetical protein VF230_18360 [Acidimicrobiales bacterium]
MSVEARKWAWALAQLGISVRWVAGAGDGLDVAVPGLAIGAQVPPTAREVADAVDGCDVVVVENLLSLPLNPAARDAVALALRGRPTVVRHHDLAWQRPQFGSAAPAPPVDRAWAHVTINELSRAELAARGVDAVTLYNRFRREEPTGAPLPPGVHGRVALQPTRAIARKNIPAAVRLAAGIGATYWLLGPAEDGYEGELARVLRAAPCPVVHRSAPVWDAYAAAAVVAFPSTWEGFGNPTIESALARRPLAIGDYPVASELRAFGFRWFAADDVDAVRRFVDEPDEALLDHNEAVAQEHFSLDGLPAALQPVLERVL